MIKTLTFPFLSKEDVLAQNSPFFLLLTTSLPCLPGHKHLPFCTTPQSISLLTGWDAAWFINRFIKPIRSQIYLVDFFFNGHHLRQKSIYLDMAIREDLSVRLRNYIYFTVTFHISCSENWSFWSMWNRKALIQNFPKWPFGLYASISLGYLLKMWNSRPLLRPTGCEILGLKNLHF